MVANSVTSPLHIFLYKEHPILKQQKPALNLEWGELGWKSEWNSTSTCSSLLSQSNTPAHKKLYKSHLVCTTAQLISTPAAAKRVLTLCREGFFSNYHFSALLTHKEHCGICLPAKTKAVQELVRSWDHDVLSLTAMYKGFYVGTL